MLNLLALTVVAFGIIGVLNHFVLVRHERSIQNHAKALLLICESIAGPLPKLTDKVDKAAPKVMGFRS